MAFIDEIKFHGKAGDGGSGVVRWRQEKFIPKGGPAGGDAGRGGDLFVEAVHDLHILAKYRHQHTFEAEKGEDGGSMSLHGANGDDLTIKLPVGSIIHNLTTSEKYSLDKVGQKIKLLEGGTGGHGNEHFKGSTNTSPKEFTLGKPGQEADFFVELELFADVGLIGLPNAGKSSLLNMLTRAEARVGAYPFTTLDPNLGDFYGFVLADIPGLIEGASGGKGLGTKFLRHIKRTRMLAHLVSFENEDMMKTYKTVRKELDTYDKALLEKEEIIILTKRDLVTEKEITAAVKKFQKLSPHVFTISLYDDASIKEFGDTLVKLLRAKI